MRYVSKGFKIRSENAAKPASAPCSALVDWILTRPAVHAALDYGCGKLRYSAHLARRATRLGLVDSREQLQRSQIINGRLTTVERHIRRHWPHARIYDVNRFWRGVPHKYDLVLCANVLSTIPSRSLRTRSLQAIRACLSRTGQCLVVNQHTNSYFTEVRQNPRAIPHLDGWILPSTRGAAYYGILDRVKTTKILRSNGFRIVDTWVEGQSTFVLVDRETA